MLLDLLKRRRSIRRYTEAKIEQEKLDMLLKAALLAPSSNAIYPWEFVAVDDPKLMEELSKAKRGAELLAGAAAAVVILANTEKSDVWIEDTSIAATHLLLMAEELGLGACWVQIRQRYHDEKTTANVYVKNLLGIPTHCEVEAIVAVGYPAEKKLPRAEDTLDFKKIHRNRYSPVD